MRMPELPEVETVARQLRKVLVGKVIKDVTITKAKSWNGEVERVINSTISGVFRKSKILQIQLSNHQHILIHLKMSGQLIFVDGAKRVGGGHPTADWTHELPSKHTRVFFTFTDGTHLYFNDQRIFGWLRVTAESDVAAAFAGLAPDIIDAGVTSEYLWERIQKRSLPIKQLIMDNTIVAGVGNIYACDALNLAKISPKRPGKELTKSETERLVNAMKHVVNLGIEMGGATAHGEYVNVEGLAGKYQDVMRVYGRKGEPCPNCNTLIEKEKLAGRGTYFCPRCQV